MKVMNWISILALGLVTSQSLLAQATKSGCTKDTDCKGERVCEQKVCVNPSREVPKPAQKSSPCRAFYVGQAVNPTVTMRAVIIGIGADELSFRAETGSLTGQVHKVKCEDAANGQW
jgi:hypothetical protein